jgi:hypothetical protein
MTELKIGEVLISMLDEKGSPSVVERALVYPAHSRFALLTPDERAQVINGSPLRTAYSQTVDRESAYEILKKRADAVIPAPPRESPAPKSPAEARRPASRASQKGVGDVLGSAATSAARSVGTQLGRALIRGVLGSLTGKR